MIIIKSKIFEVCKQIKHENTTKSKIYLIQNSNPVKTVAETKK